MKHLEMLGEGSFKRYSNMTIIINIIIFVYQFSACFICERMFLGFNYQHKIISFFPQVWFCRGRRRNQPKRQLGTSTA